MPTIFFQLIVKDKQFLQHPVYLSQSWCRGRIFCNDENFFMTIHHFNRNETYELYENNGTFHLKGNTLHGVHGNHDLQTALWDSLDWIRTVSFTNLTPHDCNAIQSTLRSDDELNYEAVMNIICGKSLIDCFMNMPAICCITPACREMKYLSY